MKNKMFSLVVMFALFLGVNVSNAQVDLSDDDIAAIEAAIDLVDDAAVLSLWTTPVGLDKLVAQIGVECVPTPDCDCINVGTDEAIIDKMIDIIDNVTGTTSKGKGTRLLLDIPDAAKDALSNLKTLLLTF